jgi:hypothetical protein
MILAEGNFCGESVRDSESVPVFATFVEVRIPFCPCINTAKGL